MTRLEVGEVVQCPHGIRSGAARWAEELGRDDGDVPIDAHHALTIVALAANRPRHMGAVRIGRAVVNSRIVVEEVPTVDVVNKAVTVIVNTVGGNLERIDPDVVAKVRVVDLNAFVDDTHHHLLRTNEALCPYLGGLATESIRRSRSVTEHAPQGAVRETRVVRWVEHRIDVIVGVRVANVRVQQELLDDSFDVSAGFELQLFGVAIRTGEGLRGLRTDRSTGRRPSERRGSGAVAHQHNAVHVSGGRSHGHGCCRPKQERTDCRK